MQLTLQQSMGQHFPSLWLEEAVLLKVQNLLGGWTWGETSRSEGKGQIL